MAESETRRAIDRVPCHCDEAGIEKRTKSSCVVVEAIEIRRCSYRVVLGEAANASATCCLIAGVCASVVVNASHMMLTYLYDLAVSEIGRPPS